jgi:hypothetical protein
VSSLEDTPGGHHLQGVLQRCPPRVPFGVSSKVSSRKDTLPILFINRKLYSLHFHTVVQCTVNITVLDFSLVQYLKLLASLVE